MVNDVGFVPCQFLFRLLYFANIQLIQQYWCELVCETRYFWHRWQTETVKSYL